eukprot:270175_1
MSLSLYGTNYNFNTNPQCNQYQQTNQNPPINPLGAATGTQSVVISTNYPSSLLSAPVTSPQMCSISADSDRSDLTTRGYNCHLNIHNNTNPITQMKAGEYVYDSKGDVIGILDSYRNVIRFNGQCNILRPLTTTAPSAINAANSNTDNSADSSHAIPKPKMEPGHENDSQPTISEHSLNAKNAKKPIKTITRSTMKRGRHISDTEKPFVCGICGKGYKYLCNYRSHAIIHTDDAFVCQYCNKRFGRKSNYKEHVRIHTGEAPYKCEICSRTFKQHHGWKDHMRVHTGEKPYLCKVCGKRFTVGHNLNVHMRIHTGERPYTCQICKKSYRQKSAYNSHIKHVHGLKLKPRSKVYNVNKL